MPQDDTIPTPFDDVLDRLVRNELVDPDVFVTEHPELSAEERRLLYRLCGRGAIEAAASSIPSTTPSTSSKAPPVERIGSFRLGELIGAGGMGAVFRAYDETLGREIAVKILGPDLVGSGERAERFLREVRAVARLRHPNIVGVYSAGEQDGLRYMAMELVEGSSLQDVIAAAAARGTRMPVPRRPQGRLGDRARPRRRPPGRHRPSRREALEHPDRDRWPRGPPRLRPRAGGGRA